MLVSEGQEVLTDCNLNKSQEMESMENVEDMKELNQSNEEAGGKVGTELWIIIVMVSFYSSDYAVRVITKFILYDSSVLPACL